MRSVRAARYLCFLLAALPLASWADESSPAVDSLISQLGDAQFSVRERATAELITLGNSALAALDAARDSRDREVRIRSAKIAAAIRRVDFDRRLEKFASGPSEENDATFPGWRLYAERIGDDAAARSLFVDMQRAEPDLMSAAASVEPREAERILADRLRDAGAFLQNPEEDEAPLTLVAACLWAASQERLPLGEEAGASLFAMCHQSNVKDVLVAEGRAAEGRAAEGATNQGASPPLRRLLGGAIRRMDGLGAYPAMALAMNLSIEDGLAPAERLIKQGAGQPQLLQFAILTIARFGETRHMALLETLFTNEARCAGYRADDVEHVAQVRDLALAACLHLAGESLPDYGFANVQTQTQTVFAPASLGFAREEDRTLAFRKWANNSPIADSLRRTRKQGRTTPSAPSATE